MKIRKKSIDPLADKYVLAAKKKNIDLTWDMHEDNLPHCGFGELGLCCTKCWQGPCRIDPFENNAKYGSCGRDGLTIATENLAVQLLSGLAPVNYVVEDWTLNKEYRELNNWLNGGMNLERTVLLNKLNTLLKKSFDKLDLKEDQQDISAKFEPGKKKVVLSGLISANTLKQLKKRNDISLYSLLNEYYYPGVKPITNYGSQEFILMTNFPDLLLVGSGCGKPALKNLAKKYEIPFVYENDFSEEMIDSIESDEMSELDNLDFQFSTDYETGLKQAKKIALVAGCNNIRNSQDYKLFKVTEHLLQSGYTVLTSGCAAMGLNKYFSASDPIYYLGSCFTTPTFKKVANHYGVDKEVVAIFPELSQMKAMTQAVYLSLQGINTYVLSKALVPPFAEFKEMLNQENKNLKIKSEGYSLEQITGILK